jgi:ElaB/YqjD/DUF883 family membrane-anchored ribosome-binding protein
MSTQMNTEQLVKDLKSVARDAEELVKSTAGEVSERAREARVRLAAAIETAKQTCQRWEEKAVEGAKATEKVIGEHPYESMGVAFALGVLLGVLVTRK